MRIANLLPLFTLTLGACAVGTDDADGYETYLVAAVDRPSGNRVEFYAAADGLVMMSERYALDSQPTLAPELVVTVDPRDYYRALTGEDAPEELALLVEAGDVPRRRFAAGELALTDGPRRPSPWWITATVFEEALCNKYPDADKKWCVLNKVNADDYKETHDVNGVFSAACSERGELELRAAIRPRSNWNRTSWIVPPGDCRAWWLSSSGDFDAEAAVLDTAGDKYHHAGMMCWSWGGHCPVITPPLPD